MKLDFTRRSVLAGFSLIAAPAVVLTGADNAPAQEKKAMPEKSLYERLGGVFAIAAVVDHFSDAVVKNPIVGQESKNPHLREWHTKNLGRLPGLKFMRTLWVCNVSGGPYQFTATKPGAPPLGLEEAHRDLRISPSEFDEVAAELGRTLDFVKVPKAEKGEVLAAFAAHKDEVTAGYAEACARPIRNTEQTTAHR
jgi:hemoglobin